MRLKPGERLSENELALRFGTSRSPVREALIRLVEEGLIDVLPQRGSFVARISLAAVRRARFVREAIEVAIVRQAAQRGLGPEVVARLEGAIAAQEAAREDAEGFSRADDAFHATFADGIGLAVVWEVVEREKAQLDRIRFLSLPATTPTAALILQHREIVRAVTTGDVAGAEAAMRVHLSEVLKIVDALAARHPELIDDD